jgi:hypothetical protein
LRHADDLLLLFVIHRIGGAPASSGGAVFHLHKTEVFPVPRDDVDLPGPAPEIARNYAIIL